MAWGKIMAILTGAAVTSVVGYLNRDKISDGIDLLVIALKGKKVGVLGARGSGKTTLLTFLSKGELPSQNTQTISAKLVGANRLKLRDLAFNLKETKDLPGGEAALQQWRELHDTSDFVIYLIKAEEMDIDRVTYDLGCISKWQNQLEKKPKLILVATHMDLNSCFVTLKDSEKGDFQDQFIGKYQRFLSSFKYRPNIYLGALNNKANTEVLVSDLIEDMYNG